MLKTTPHPVGKTKDAGWQIGVRRTFNVSPPAAWRVLTSPQGLRLWLGEVDTMPMRKKERYQTADGTTGEIRAIEPGGHVRLTWQPSGWESPSILQVRVRPNGPKTTISFHQERLTGPEQREQMRDHWKQVMQTIEALLR